MLTNRVRCNASPLSHGHSRCFLFKQRLSMRNIAPTMQCPRVHKLGHSLKVADAMTDDEQLHYAALAGGYTLTWIDGAPHATNSCGITAPWNPLQSEGDAHRLAVSLCIGIKFMPGMRQTFTSCWPYAIMTQWDDFGDGRYGATLAGIVEVAAMMGRVASYSQPAASSAE
jgi:hypothetical protein